MLAGGGGTSREFVGLLQHLRVHPLLDYLHRPVVECLLQSLDFDVQLTELGLLVAVGEASTRSRSCSRQICRCLVAAFLRSWTSDPRCLLHRSQTIDAMGRPLTCFGGEKMALSTWQQRQQQPLR